MEMKFMSTEMTPMKRYSTGLSTLKSNVDSICKLTELNRAASKRGQNGQYTKGVDSDYILIFSDRRSESSFALVFEYMGLTAEKQRVVGSVKITEDGPIQNSFNMTLEEFKTNLNALNKEMEAVRVNRVRVDYDFPKVLALFSKHMLKEVIDLEKDLKIATSTVSKFLSKKMKELENEGYEDKVTTAEKSLEKAQRAVFKKIADSPLTAERKVLLDRIKEIDKLLETEKKNLTAKADITGKKQAVVDSKQALAEKRNEIDKDVDTQLEKFPVAVRKRVKNSI